MFFCHRHTPVCRVIELCETLYRITSYNVCYTKLLRGLKLTAQEVEQRFDVQLSFEPKYLTTEMLFLGLIPKTNDFEALETPFVDEHGYPDFVEDDSAP